MGDDTWMTVFPDSFHHNMSFPYDSFNVEDLHTVDEGVIRHLFPLLEDPSKPFDFLVGHFLGVDHVGHRVSPDHPNMISKLQQMDDVLRRVVDLLDDDTLLVLLGDHGMDRTGDHGGDGVFETSAALWIYSKGRELSTDDSSVPSGLVEYTTFPGADVPHRWIQQIDLVPTLALLLGLPIPFNNLGSLIPELFWRDPEGKDYHRGLQSNAAQIKSYLDAYRSSSSGGELSPSWDTLLSAWDASQAVHPNLESELITLHNFNRVSLSVCRSIWAQFNPIMMAFGLGVLAISVFASSSMFTALSTQTEDWNKWLGDRLYRALKGFAGGAVFGVLAAQSFAGSLEGIDALECVLFAASVSSSIMLIAAQPPNLSFQTLTSFPIILFLHTIVFLSNSFTFWEDRESLFFAVSSLVPFVRIAMTSPAPYIRNRILYFLLTFAVCVRIISISTICREEQQPYCHVTFYAAAASPPILVIFLAPLVAISVPQAFRRLLKVSKADVGYAKLFIPSILTPTLLAGTVFWLIEWADSTNLFGEDWSNILRLGRTWTAILAMILALGVGLAMWWLMPLCIDVEMEEFGDQRSLKVIGFGNAFGAPYLLFWSIFFAIVYISSQLAGQVVLGLGAIAMIALLEAIDGVKEVEAIHKRPSALIDEDVREQEAPAVAFSHIVPLALLGIVTFYGTGHQAVISSIQWKSAFILAPTVVYPWAPMTASLNSWGMFLLTGISAPLLALWNRKPRLSLPPAPPTAPTAPNQKSKSGSKKDKEKEKTSTANDIANKNALPSDLDDRINRESIMAGLGMMTYYACLLLGTAISAAVLRRHLMVWKVFAPRFMLGAVSALFVDVGVLIGLVFGVRRIRVKVNGILGPIFRRQLVDQVHEAK
jgi:GPI ethanolamine phosphate transferase 3 subunit O